jgi:hypothetical protein
MTKIPKPKGLRDKKRSHRKSTGRSSVATPTFYVLGDSKFQEDLAMHLSYRGKANIRGFDFEQVESLFNSTSIAALVIQLKDCALGGNLQWEDVHELVSYYHCPVFYYSQDGCSIPGVTLCKSYRDISTALYQ